jgi:hypothetical protein
MKQALDEIEAGKRAAKEGNSLMTEDEKGDKCTLEEAEETAMFFQEMQEGMMSFIRAKGPTSDYVERQRNMMKKYGIDPDQPGSNPVQAMYKSQEVIK